MIKVPYTLQELDAKAASFYKKIEAAFSLTTTITNRNVLNDEATPVFTYILKNVESIITGRPDKLEFHINQIDNLITVAKANYRIAHPGVTNREVAKWLNNEMFMVFNYDYDNNSFSKIHQGKMAYDHALLLDLSTCLYCNAQFTFTIKKKKYKTRPHFDHFFPKSKHPYLALSFYNLIPACYICNSNLKGSKPFLYSTHLHPFVEGFEGIFEFQTNIDSVDFLVNKKDFKIKLVKKSTSNKDDVKRAKKNITVFALDDRYNFHKDYAGEIITKSHIYNDSEINELLRDYEITPGKKLFSSEGEIIELFLGNYIHESRLHKRILSKLTKDIGNELGLRV
ncbi:MAG: HNH endonuclease [Bacteroidetes bacterium]|nr:HNH endonuclease [Bacteroidota bacterium]